ncbi:MAG TPA: FAD-dependent oxidoreductase [Actinocrinis sp.]|jgi:phytoene dehydrogenase-like protein
MRVDVCVIGAGLAGLAAAVELAAAGLEVAVAEQADRPGGRARGRRVDGYTLAEGDHLVHTAWTAVRAAADPAGLRLAEFADGVSIQQEERRLSFGTGSGGARRVAAGIRAAAGSAQDKMRISRLVHRLAIGGLDRALAGPEHAAADSFELRGFSTQLVDQILRPLLAGLAADEDLASSIRGADWLLRLLVHGRFAVPEQGIGALAEALARQLPEGALHLSAKVRTVHTYRVTTDAGRIDTRAVIVAADPRAAYELIPGVFEPEMRAVTTLWHVADDGELPEDFEPPQVVLDAAPSSPIARTAVMSRAAATLAPPGRALIATSVTGGDGRDPGALDRAVRSRLGTIHGTDMSRWQTLDIRHTDRGLVTLRSPYNFSRPVRIIKGLYVCGDHRDLPNVEGALRSGSRAAAAVLEDLDRVADSGRR